MSILSAIGTVIGGLLGSRSSDNANEANLQATRETNWTNRRLVHAANRQNKYLAKNSIRIRARDARKAGIHPLAAMGAPSFGGIVQAGNVQAPPPRMPNYALGDAIAAGAQQLGDALDPLSAENARLQNELLRSQINATNANTALSIDAATSRTAIAAMRSGAVGGASPTPSTTILPGGRELKNTSGYTDQAFQNKYGEWSLIPSGVELWRDIRQAFSPLNPIYSPFAGKDEEYWRKMYESRQEEPSKRSTTPSAPSPMDYNYF